MILKCFWFPHGPLEVNVFLMADETSREALLVDAGVFDPSVVAFAQAQGLNLTTVLITHLHPDHIEGLPGYIRAGAHRVIAPGALAAAPQAEIAAPGQTFSAAGFEFRVLKTSGHTPEGVSYYCPAHDLCFVGDALFAGAVGGTSDDRLHAEEIENIKRFIMPLPAETRIYSGHGPATTVAVEKIANPFLQPGFTRRP